METIKITPTWESILPVLLTVYENGKRDGRKTAQEELVRMAKLADLYVKSQESK